MSSEVTLIRGLGAAGWNLSVYEVTGSTNDVARGLPAWSAARADRQTAGRGRFGRAFVSDAGGLWLSAVLPAEGGPEVWNGFSLMVGCHLLRMLRGLGLGEARLRWPNDLMIGSRKLGGLLIEQSSHGMLIVGLGLNVSNLPWEQDASLAATTTRLQDLLKEAPDLNLLASQVLDAMATAHEDMLQRGLPFAVTEFNAHHQSRTVVLTLTQGEAVRGVFTGLDPAGNLLLQEENGAARTIEHQLVGRLQETD